MAKTPLFQNWSWKRTLPEPFDKEDAVSTASYSKYCIGSTKKATLHSAALSAILAYMDMDTAVDVYKRQLTTIFNDTVIPRITQEIEGLFS